MLVELGLDYEQKEIITRTASMESPEFQAVSPRTKIPILEDGEVCIGESAAICLYLADRYRGHGVFAPEPGTSERAQHDELCWFTMTEIDAVLYTIRRHEGLPEIYGASDIAVEAARAYFLRSAAELERRLADGRSHLLGEDFTVADMLAKSCLDWAALVCRIEIPSILATYGGRISERPAFQEAMKRNFTPAAMAALTGSSQ